MQDKEQICNKRRTFSSFMKIDDNNDDYDYVDKSIIMIKSLFSCFYIKMQGCWTE